MSGGGEILRAVMESASVYSNPALYCIPLNGDDGTANARTNQRTFFQLHRELWFLCTGIVPTATGASFGYERNDAAEFVRIFDPADNANLAFVPLDMQMTLYGDSTINNPLTLPEYVLFAPSSLIGVEWDAVNFNVPTAMKFLTLVGVEYGMGS